MKRLVVDMDESLHTAIKIEALKQGTSAKKLVTEMIWKQKKSKHGKFGDQRDCSKTRNP